MNYKVDVVSFDGKEYYLLKYVKDNEKCYCYFVNTSDNTDLCIRKFVVKNGQELLMGLDDEAEFIHAMQLFNE